MAETELEYKNWPGTTALSKLRESFAKVFDRSFDLKKEQQSSYALSFVWAVMVGTILLSFHFPSLVKHATIAVVHQDKTDYSFELDRFVLSMTNPIMVLLILFAIISGMFVLAKRSYFSFIGRVSGMKFIHHIDFERWIKENSYLNFSRWTVRHVIFPISALFVFIFYSYEGTADIVYVGHGLQAIFTMFGWDVSSLSRPDFSRAIFVEIFTTDLYWTFLSIFYCGSFYVWWFLSYDYHRRYRSILSDIRGFLRFGNIFTDVIATIYGSARNNTRVNFDNAIEIISIKMTAETRKINRLERVLLYFLIPITIYGIIRLLIGWR